MTDDIGRAMTSAERMRRHRARLKEAGGAMSTAPPSLEARQRYRASSAGQAARARYRKTDGAKKAKLRSKQRARIAARDGRPFTGVDGEGCGTDALGRQLYMLLRAGDRELYTGQALSTAECLDFLCECDSRPILVGFSFGYDVTMILRDLPPERRARLLADKEAQEGQSRYTYWGDFGIEYLPKNYLRICRTERVRIVRDGAVVDIRRRIPGTARTIYETFGFFQMSFLKAINAFGVGADHAALIERNKAARGNFDGITQEIRDYCRIECQLLAEMMQRFRETCIAADIRPRTWNGAGKLSAALHQSHRTMTAAQLAERAPPDLLAMASAAYYGGRFEVPRIGRIAGPVYEYDLKSAYPAAMLNLPCLEHGRWLPASPAWLRKAPADALYVAPVRFRHDPRGDGPNALCGLPIRQKSGRLTWPAQGNGVYWSTEIRSAARLGCVVTYKPGWRYERACDCRPFDWVNSLYEYRQSLGGNLKGYPIKLGINGLYGKLAQRIGSPRWANLIWAGLITAATRAALNEAAADDPAAVVMLATDALFSIRPLGVPIGEALGQWEAAQHGQLFVVQPGIYWGAAKPKTRGVPASFFADHTATFEAAWQAYADRDRAAFDLAGVVEPPTVPLPLTLFIGLKLAQARGKPETAGKWVQQERQFSFKWSGKRGRHRWETPSCCWTYPLPGSPDLYSQPHKSDLALLAQLDAEKLELEDQPDPIDLTPPWRD